MTTRRLTDALRETFGVFERVGPGIPLTTSEVTDALDVSRRSTYDRLQRLVDRDRIETKEVGARGRVWWLPVGTDDPDTGRDDGECDTDRDDGERCISERGASERDRQLYETIVETVVDGVYALDEDEYFVLVNDAFCEMSGYDREELLGAHSTLVASTDTVEEANEVEARVASDEVDQGVLEFDLQTADGGTVPIETHLGPYRFDEEIRGRCGIVRDVSDRLERERALESHRARIEALNHLNDVVREITDSIIDQSTREEIERVVCEALAETDSYAFAWVGEVDANADVVRLRAEAGVENYLEALELSLDPSDTLGTGPAATAIRSAETQVVNDARADFDVGAWRDHARRHDFRSLASIPIAHEGIVYGVLNVYATRPDAFAAEEQPVLGQLGEVVGHAIAAVERKRALTSDQVHEIDFRIASLFSVLGVDTTAEARITMDQFVPIGGDAFLLYGTVTPTDLPVLEALVEVHTGYDSVRIVGGTVERKRFEARISESILSLVASLGGVVDAAWIDSADFHMTVQLPYRVNVRRFIETFQAEYGMVEVRAQRQVMRREDDAVGVRSTLEAGMTERQRTVLKTAYFAGFFDSPRRSSGSDVAASLGISAPTFHEHLRKAQRTLLRSVHGDATSDLADSSPT